MPTLSTPVKATIISASIGFALIAVLATYFKRRRGRKYFRDVRKNAETLKNVNGIQNPQIRRSRSPVASTTPNGELTMRSQSSKRQASLSHGDSLNSINTVGTAYSGASAATLTEHSNTADADPTKLCDLGLESLQKTICFWEDALEKLEVQEQTSGHTNASHEAITNTLKSHLQLLLHRAYNIQDLFEQKIITHVNASVAIDSAVLALKEMDRTYEENKRKKTMSFDDSSSDIDSFVSALETADLSDLEDQKSSHTHLVFYEAALLELTHGSIPYRMLRTKMVGCSSDTEFLSKLHCIRIALTEIFQDESIRKYFAESGKKIISDLLLKADRDPEEFEAAYDDMIMFVENEKNWDQMETELKGRGVKAMNFYDIVIDFILFDAFDDLENPPSSVTSVIQNRWLSNGFKETALSTAVWSVLKAKKRMLKYSKGFIAHFYALTAHVSPVLAWGFMGPEGELKDLCNFFRDQVLAFMCEVFSFGKVRYSSVSQLSDDLLYLARKRIAIISERLQS